MIDSSLMSEKTLNLSGLQLTEGGVSGVNLPPAVRAVEEDLLVASGTAITPHLQMEARTAQGNILSLGTVTQILVSHSNNYLV